MYTEEFGEIYHYLRFIHLDVSHSFRSIHRSNPQGDKHTDSALAPSRQRCEERQLLERINNSGGSERDVQIHTR